MRSKVTVKIDWRKSWFQSHSRFQLSMFPWKLSFSFLTLKLCHSNLILVLDSQKDLPWDLSLDHDSQKSNSRRSVPLSDPPEIMPSLPSGSAAGSPSGSGSASWALVVAKMTAAISAHIRNSFLCIIFKAPTLTLNSLKLKSYGKTKLTKAAAKLSSKSRVHFRGNCKHCDFGRTETKEYKVRDMT